MACPHFKISIRSRSGGESAAAGSAYISGENLYSDYDHRMRYYHYKAKEVMAKDVLLPTNAPAEFANRQTLWNAVEAAEKQWNAQLSRDIIIALPNEIPAEQHEALIREYCQQQFVSKGMVVDYAIHDKKDGNPHAHIMLALRAMDENGKWLPKSRKVYDLDENGNRIHLPSGNWKSHKENTVDWNGKDKAELWRSSWAELVNIYLERLNRPERIDLRSYERQGKEIVPTVHLGPAVAHLEARGIQTEIGNYNREIIDHNRKVLNLKKLITEIGQRIKRLIEKLKPQRNNQSRNTEPLIGNYVIRYNEMRKQGRGNWSKKAQETAGLKDLKLLANTMAWMSRNNIGTLSDFSHYIEGYQAQFDRLKVIGKENHRLETALRHLDNHAKLLPIFEQSKRGFASTREKYAEAHKEELESFRKSVRYMRANGITPEDEARLRKEKRMLAAEREQINSGLEAANVETELIRQIMNCIETVQKADAVEKLKNQQSHAEYESASGSTKKESIHNQLRQAKYETNVRAAERSPKNKKFQEEKQGENVYEDL